MKQTVYIEALTTDPDFNLALEEYVFNHMPRDKEYLMTWRNDNAIIIGKNQNPWKECDLAAMERDGVQLVRRVTGGGAVYHDSGNLNFSFITGEKRYDLDEMRSGRVTRHTLRRLGGSAVNVYPQHFMRLKEAGVLECPAGNEYGILLDNQQYDEACGLALEPECGNLWFC